MCARVACDKEVVESARDVGLFRGGNLYPWVECVFELSALTRPYPNTYGHYLNYVNQPTLQRILEEETKDLPMRWLGPGSVSRSQWRRKR